MTQMTRTGGTELGLLLFKNELKPDLVVETGSKLRGIGVVKWFPTLPLTLRMHPLERIKGVVITDEEHRRLHKEFLEKYT